MRRDSRISPRRDKLPRVTPSGVRATVLMCIKVKALGTDVALELVLRLAERSEINALCICGPALLMLPRGIPLL